MPDIENDITKFVELLASLKQRTRIFTIELQQQYGENAVVNLLEVLECRDGNSVEFCVELKIETEEFISWWFIINIKNNGWSIERYI